MKLLMKPLVILVLLAQLLSSCFTYKSLTKKEPVTLDFISKLKPGKKYKFELKTGQTLVVHVVTIDTENITGYIYRRSGGKTTKESYSETFQSIEQNVAKISVRKFNPYLTTVSIVVPIGLAILVVSNATWISGF